jgi:two-component system, NtrC family, sensor kinase
MDQIELYHRQVQASLRVAEAMNAAHDQATLLKEMLAAIVDTLGYRAAILRLLDPERGTLELAAAHGLSDQYLHKGEVALARSTIDQQVFAGQVVATRDIEAEPNLAYPAAALQEGLRAVLAVPLRLGGRTVGALRVFDSQVHDFGNEEKAFLAGIANLAARAIASARLYHSFRAIAHEINSTLEVRQMLRAMLASLIGELNVKGAAVRLLGPRGQRLHLAAAEGLSQAYLDKGEIRVAESPIDRRVLDERKPVVLYDIVGEPGFQYPEAAAQEGIRSVLAVPLGLRETTVGVLRVYSAQPHRFTGEEIALVEAVADLGALALDNARLHEALREKYEAAREDWAGWYRYLSFS